MNEYTFISARVLSSYFVPDAAPERGKQRGQDVQGPGGENLPQVLGELLGFFGRRARLGQQQELGLGTRALLLSSGSFGGKRGPLKT